MELGLTSLDGGKLARSSVGCFGKSKHYGPIGKKLVLKSFFQKLSSVSITLLSLYSGPKNRLRFVFLIETDDEYLLKEVVSISFKETEIT